MIIMAGVYIQCEVPFSSCSHTGGSRSKAPYIINLGNQLNTVVSIGYKTVWGPEQSRSNEQQDPTRPGNQIVMLIPTASQFTE
jgi:hypothetical protein